MWVAPQFFPPLPRPAHRAAHRGPKGARAEGKASDRNTLPIFTQLYPQSPDVPVPAFIYRGRKPFILPGLPKRGKQNSKAEYWQSLTYDHNWDRNFRSHQGRFPNHTHMTKDTATLVTVDLGCKYLNLQSGDCGGVPQSITSRTGCKSL